MDEALAAIEGLYLVKLLRFDRWLYAAVNTGHVLGIAMLVGGILPLDLRLLGLWRASPVEAVARVSVPVAAAGLLLAVMMGLLLFSVRAREYAALEILWIKLGLIAVGGTAAIALHLSHGWLMRTAGPGRLALHGALSIVCWLGALTMGRLIAFVA